VVALLTIERKCWIIEKVYQHTRIDTDVLRGRLELNSDGILNRALPTCSIRLFSRDPIVAVSKEINNDVEFIASFCPIFK
jgi:hypothetical protein